MADEENIEFTHKYDYKSQFDPQAYLEHFFSESATKSGLRLSLFAMPRFIRRLPETFRCKRLLDIGSGPTIYMAACFRELAEKVYLSDYTESSRLLLQQWLDSTQSPTSSKSMPDAKSDNEMAFNWMPMAKALALSEGSDGTECDLMLKQTRSCIAGVWHCDVHDANVVCDAKCHFDTHQAFDVVTSIFCLESACANFAQYSKCMKNCVSRLKSGGYFFLGSVLEDTVYEYGKDQFDLLYLTKDDIDKAMWSAGLDVESAFSMEHEGAVIIMCKKL